MGSLAKSFAWGKRTYIMGILNVTPDSFSDGGDFKVDNRGGWVKERLKSLKHL